MKKLILMLSMLLFFLIGRTATYYVSDSDGNDSDSGLTTALAWKTLAKVNSVTLAAGDKVLLKRGDTFVGTLTLSKSSSSASTPVTYGAYGTGAKPIVTSMQTLSGWTLHSGKIYKVTGIPANCDVVTINGVSVSMGRYPQGGNALFESNTFTSKSISKAEDYSGTVSGTTIFTTSTTHGLSTGTMVTVRNTTSYDGYYSATVVNTTQFYITKSFVSNQTGTLLYNTTITDNELTGTPSFNGAEVVIWKSNWTIDRGPITGHSGSTLTYVSGSSYAIQSSGGLKYYIQRSLETLTYQGAWYTDGTTFYMYFENNDPESYTVKAGSADYTIYLSSKNYNTVRDIEVQGGNVAAIYCTSSAGFSVKNVTLKNAGLIGIKAILSTVTTIDSCSISYVNGTSISINSAGSYIGNCTIDRSGQFGGMGEPSGGSHYGIYTKGTGNVTEYNRILNTGYIPIFWESSYAICRFNYIDNYPLLLLNDGGGAYTFESTTPQIGKKCYGNFITNSTANGLYSDGIANNVEFYDNTVYNVDKWGLHMNEPINNSVHHNTFVDCGLAAIDVSNQYFMGAPAASGNTAYSNLVVQASADQVLYSLQDQNTNNAILNFGTSNGNTFIVSPAATTVFFNQKGSASSLPFSALSYTWANWKTLTGKESSSTYRTEDLSTLTFIYNETKVAKTVSITGAKTNLAGSIVYQNSVTLQPFTSLLLLPTTVPNVNGYTKIVKHGNVPVKHGNVLVVTK